MKIIGLDGRQYVWKLIGHVPLLDEQGECSQLHLNARKVLTKLFPLYRIVEEITLPGSGGLAADFFIPQLLLMIEVQGEQHYKFIPHFHQNIFNFIASKKRDSNKRRWCELNNICLVELPYSEDTDVWERRILDRKTTIGENRQGS